jgi:trigger factor
VIDVLGVAGTVPTLFGPGGETLLQTEGGREVYNVQGHEHEVNPQGPVEFAPGFDEELIGLQPGADKKFGLTLPTDFPDPSLANQSIVFTVKVGEVKEKNLPELNEEFAKKLNAESVEELREEVRKSLQARMERESQTLFENALVDAVVERSTIEIPDVMVERQIDAQIADLKADLSRERITWQDYLLLSKQSEEQVRATMRESGMKTLRSYLALREVARKEGIQVEPEEVDAEIEATASQFGAAANVVRERLSTRDQRERIESRLFYQKAVKRLADIATQPSEGETEAATELAATPAESTEETATPTVASETPAQSAEAAAPAEAGEAADLPRTNEETGTHG